MSEATPSMDQPSEPSIQGSSKKKMKGSSSSSSRRLVPLLLALFFLGIIEIFLSMRLVNNNPSNQDVFNQGDDAPLSTSHAHDDNSRTNNNIEEIKMQTLLGQLYFGDEASTANNETAKSIPDGSYRFPAKYNNNNNHNNNNNSSASAATSSSFNFRPVLFITTHMSDSHIWHLDACWPPAMRNSKLLSRSDVMVYFTSSRDDDDRWRPMNKLRRRFRHQNLTIHARDNPGYEEGAMASMKEAMTKRWFNDYDWVVRLNPDVFVRNETFILDTMENDPNATGILIDCDAKRPLKAIHTDFYAVKPSVLSRDAFMNVSLEGGMTVEGRFGLDVRRSIIDPGNARWVPGSQPAWHTCRAGFGRRMEEADVFHYHLGKDLSRPWADVPEPDGKDLDCPIPF